MKLPRAAARFLLRCVGESVRIGAVKTSTPPTATDRPQARRLKDDIAEYQHDLVRRGLAVDTVRKRYAIVQQFADLKELRTIADVTAAAAQEFLADRKQRLKWSGKTHDNHLDSLRDFGVFLESLHPGWESPFRKIRRARRTKVVYGDELTGSRAFTEAEQMAIIAHAEKICGKRRALGRATNNRDWCYRVFADTGLRRGEMKKLPWSHVHIDARPWRIVCDKDWNKTRKDQVIPLTDQAREYLVMQRAYTGDQERVWTVVPHLHTLDKDMRAAGVPKRDSRGRRAGFHSFRKGLNRRLRLSNVDPETRMRWMRHSTPALTLGTYGDVLPEDLAKAVRRLQDASPRPAGQTGISTSCLQGGLRAGEDLTDGAEGVDDGRAAPGPPNKQSDRPLDSGLGPGLQHSLSGLESTFGQPHSAARALQETLGVQLVGIGGSNPPPSALNPQCLPPEALGHHPPNVAVLAAAFSVIFSALRDALTRPPPFGSPPDGRP